MLPDWVAVAYQDRNGYLRLVANATHLDVRVGPPDHPGPVVCVTASLYLVLCLLAYVCLC